VSNTFWKGSQFLAFKVDREINGTCSVSQEMLSAKLKMKSKIKKQIKKIKHMMKKIT